MLPFVVDHFEACAQAFASRPAIICEDGSRITYAELNAKADCVAALLVKVLKLDGAQSFESTQMIGLMMERHISTITMMLAIHKAGCAYVPVDPAFPPDRQQYIMEHSKCNVLIIDKECQELAKSTGLVIPAKNIFFADNFGSIISRTEDGEEKPIGEVQILPSVMQHVRKINNHVDSIAYVLYTSGSTGKPKGVAVKQIGVENIIKFFADEIKCNEQDKILGLTTFCFDISVLETFVPLIKGACNVLANSSTRKDPFRIIELMETNNVTIFQATPTTFEMMLATGWEGDANVTFLVGGEAFRPSLVPIARCCKAFLNVYGPTETTIWSTYYYIAKDYVVDGPVPIGQAISKTDLYVVADGLPWREVNCGEEGELLIGGIGVAAGYLNAPDLTKERFIANPFGDGFVYRTGDVVKQLPNKNYVFVRRLDDQVKIDGFRIELEEIEKVFMESPHIEQAVAQVRNNKLVLFIKTVPETKVITNRDDEDELEPEVLSHVLEEAARKLTYYMMPKFVRVVKDFAKTPNGKLDKKALPTPKSLAAMTLAPMSVSSAPIPLPPVTAMAVKSPVVAQGTAVAALVASTSLPGHRPISALICDAIEQLRGQRPPVTASFGAFGLDSLGSVMLMRSLNTALQKEIPLKMTDLFAPGVTIKSLGITLFNRATDGAKAKLKLVPECDDDLGASGMLDIETGSSGASEPMEDFFGASLLANKRLFEGMRGIFTFMVLWDHWRPAPIGKPSSFNVNTTFFFLISGYTTASQLRMSPEFASDDKQESTVKPREPFAFWKYLLVRAVGLYPILWLTLVLNAPLWVEQDEHEFTKHAPGLPQERASAICTALYVFGMHIWYDPCTFRGPNVWYASNIIVIMFFYGVYRFLMTEALRKMCSWVDGRAVAKELLTNHGELSTVVTTSTTTTVVADAPACQGPCATVQTTTTTLGTTVVATTIVGNTATTTTTVTLASTWLDYLGRVAHILSYNLFCLEIFIAFTAFIVVISILLMWGIEHHKAQIEGFMQHFFIAAWCLPISEMWCKYEVSKAIHQPGASPEDIRQNLMRLKDFRTPADDSQRLWVSFLNRTGINRLLARFNANAVIPELFDDINRPVESPRKPKDSSTATNRYLFLLWRFSPDLIALIVAILLSDICSETETTFTLFIQYMLAPFLLLLFVVIGVHQRGDARYNLSRFVLETDAANFVGYASYPTYLLQNCFLQYYFTYIIPQDGYHLYPGDMSRIYYRRLPVWIRFLSMILFLIITWLIQKYFQDNLVAGGFARVLQWWSRPRPHA